MNKTVIITGVTGQMGSYFSEYLLDKGYKVIGTIRRISVKNHKNIEHITNPNFILEPMDLGDVQSINNLILKWKPEYFINCAANSFVGSSWDFPEQHFGCNALAVLRQLEAIRHFSPQTRYLNFGSSEEFGNVIYSPQDAEHPLRARSPYGASKIAARQIVRVYRESFNLYAIQPWCFNYESVRRGEEFVTRKITKGVARIKHAIDNNESFEPIELGNLDAVRDWSDSNDFVAGIWKMLNQEEHNPEIGKRWKEQSDKYLDMVKLADSSGERHKRAYQIFLSQNIKEYVLASGEMHTVRDFVFNAFCAANISTGWLKDKVTNEEVLVRVDDPTNFDAIYKQLKTPLVSVNKKFYRPLEVHALFGDSAEIRRELGWRPKVGFFQLIKMMVDNDIDEYNK